MTSGWWGEPVPVLIGSNTTHHVTRPSKAAELLLYDWPVEDGPAYRRAKVALLKALENPDDDKINAASRKAFEAAAREAGILVPLPEGGDYIRR